VELSKLNDFSVEAVAKMSKLEKWAAFFGYADDSDKRGFINEIIRSEEAISMASETLTSISRNPAERLAYMSRRRVQTDRDSDLITSRAIGIAEGINAMLNLLKQGLTPEEAAKRLRQ